MGKLGNYILNVFLSFILLSIAIALVEYYLIAAIIVFAKNVVSVFVRSNCFSCRAHKRLHFAAL